MPANNTEIEKHLWDVADELRANSRLRASDYSRPVLGLIFLRYAGHRFDQAHQEILAERAAATHRLPPHSEAHYHERESPDVEGHSRRAIVFELARIDGFIAEEPEPVHQEPGQQPLTALRERAMASSAYGATPRERMIQAHARSQAVRTYVFARANGNCEACGEPAPFKTSGGRPYLESHHIRSLSDAGPDDPHWVIALCPNCHRRAHYGKDTAEFKKQLAATVDSREKTLGSA